MKLGILGTGMIVKDLLHTIDSLNIDEVYLLATEKSKEMAQKMADEHHFKGVFTNYDELLKTDVDTIYVALPNFLHYSFSKKALEAGKNVICEKPFTSNYKEAEELAALAEKKHLIIIEAMTVHYLPAVQAIKKDLSQLGNLKIVSLNYSQYSSRYDRFKEGIILPVFDVHKSGGALYDLNVYNVHFIVELFGQPKSVDYLANIAQDIDTSGILTLDYGSFKAVSIGAKDCKAPLMNTIQGDLGNIIVNTPVSRMTSYTIGDNSGKTSVKDYNENRHAMSYEFNEFIDIIDHKNEAKAKQMLEISLIASEIMTEARRKAGIVFDADKN